MTNPLALKADAAYSGSAGLGIGVTVARLTLDQLVQVRILDPQLCLSISAIPIRTGKSTDVFHMMGRF